MRANNSIYEFENHLKDGRMVEKSVLNKSMYDLRKMASMIKMLGRPLTNEEAEEFVGFAK